MIRNAKMLKDVLKLERAAKAKGKEFEKEHGRKPTQEEAEEIAKNLAQDFIKRYGFDKEGT